MHTFSPRAARLAAILLASAASALAARAAATDAGLPVGERFGVWPAAPTALALAGGWVAASIIWRRAGHRIAWLLMVAALLAAVSVAGGASTARSVFEDRTPWWLATASWAAMWTWFAAALIIGALMPQLFPDGRVLEGRAWRVLSWFTVIVGTAMVLIAALTPFAIAFPDIPHPILGAYLDATAWMQIAPPLTIVFSIGVPLLSVCAAASVIERLRRARGAERRRILLVGVMMLVAVVASLLPQSWIAVVVVFLYLGAIAFAVAHLGLWELESLLPRLTVGLLLIAALGGVFAATVAVVSALTGGAAGTMVAAFTAAAALAIAFDPLRRALHLFVERVFSIGNPDPEQLRVHLIRAARDAEGGRQGWAATRAVLAEALRTPGIRLELSADDHPGQDLPGGIIAEHNAIDLMWDGRRIGRVLLVPRPGATAIRRRDRRTIAALEPTLALIAHDVTLTSDLERARQESTERREATIRRIRRDLHDGLGPLLAGAALSIEAAERALRNGNPDPAGLLTAARGDLQGAVSDIRSLVHGLRPTSLDDLGLEGALRASRVADALPVEISYGAEVDPLPAAVEVALLRIAQEALTNVSRHADATHAAVHVTRDAGGVSLAVSDDGRGMPISPTPGIGIASMRERVAELGGTLDVSGHQDGGTTVAVWLPSPPHRPAVTQSAEVHAPAEREETEE